MSEITTAMKVARARLQSLPDNYFINAPNRDKRRDIIKLMKKAGFADLVQEQVNTWNKDLARRKK